MAFVAAVPFYKRSFVFVLMLSSENPESLKGHLASADDHWHPKRTHKQPFQESPLCDDFWSAERNCTQGLVEGHLCMQICDCCVNRLWQHMPPRRLSEVQTAPSSSSEPQAVFWRWLLLLPNTTAISRTRMIYVPCADVHRMSSSAFCSSVSNSALFYFFTSTGWSVQSI